MHVESDRRYVMPAAVDVVWERIADVGSYRSWWPWLSEFDGRTLATGETWRCVVRSPLRAALEFELRLDQVEPTDFVIASLDGDLVGTARLSLAAHHDGCAMRLVSALDARSAPLSTFAAVAPPLARWAHDRLLDTGADQFSRALAHP